MGISTKLLIISQAQLIMFVIIGAVICFIVGHTRGYSESKKSINTLEGNIKEYKRRIRETRKEKSNG